MDDIKVPKPPAAAFNPERPASDLLKQQVRHLEWAVRHAGQRRADFHKVKYVKTEAEAAQRIRELLPQLASATELPFTVSATEAPPAAAPPKYRKAPARKSKTKKSKGAKRPTRPKRKAARKSKRSRTSKAKR